MKELNPHQLVQIGGGWAPVFFKTRSQKVILPPLLAPSRPAPITMTSAITG
jgi:hypothetical protein